MKCKGSVSPVWISKEKYGIRRGWGQERHFLGSRVCQARIQTP